MAEVVRAYEPVATRLAPAPIPPGHERLWRWLEQLAAESARVRREEAQVDQWVSRMDLYTGKHWPATMPTFKPPIVANELHTLILQDASELSDTQLRVYVLKDPRRGGRDEDAERALRAVWVNQQVDLKLILAMVWARIVGTSFLHPYWDPDAAEGMGDAAVDVLDPMKVLPDPDAVDDQKWQYRIIDHVLDLLEIRRLFPVMGMLVEPEDRWSVKDTSSLSPEGPSTAAYLGPLYGGPSLVRGLVPGYKKARARLLDYVGLDDEVEEVVEEVTDPVSGTPVLDEQGNPKLRYVRRPKYPHGRRIVAANRVILYDGDNLPPGDFGLVRIVLEPTLKSFWGMGFVQQTAELQLAGDKLLSSTVENAVRLNQGVVISTTNTGLDWESFAGIPAQVVQINPGSNFDIKYPPPMPPDMVQAPYRMLDLQRRILGFPASRVGEGGRGNVSPELTETEISQAQATTRLAAKLLYFAVQRLVRMLFARMAWGYTTERVIPAVEGEAFKPVVWRPLERPERYTTYVDPASFTIMSKTMLRRLGMALYRLRAIDRRALLETVGWPDWEATAKRLDQADTLAAMARMRKGRR